MSGRRRGATRFYLRPPSVKAGLKAPAPMNDLLVSVLKRAAQRGATAADGYLVEESRFSASVRMREIETLNHSREQRLALRVFAGRASAAASTSDLSRESLERVVDEATALAKITAEDPHAGLPEPSALIERVPDLDLEDGSDDLSPEEKIEIARRAEAAALEADPRITNSEGAEYSDRRARYAYATSHGFVQGYSTTSFGISVAPIASRNGEMQRDYWYSSARKRARLEDPAAVGRTARRARAAAAGRPEDEDGRGARRVRPGHRGEPRALDRGRGQRPEPLSPRLVPAGPPRHEDRVADVTIVDDPLDPGGARLEAVRRRGAGDRAGPRWSARACSSPTCSTPTARASSASSPRTTPAGTAAGFRSPRATSCCCRARRPPAGAHRVGEERASTSPS